MRGKGFNPSTQHARTRSLVKTEIFEALIYIYIYILIHIHRQAVDVASHWNAPRSQSLRILSYKGRVTVILMLADK